MTQRRQTPTVEKNPPRPTRGGSKPAPTKAAAAKPAARTPRAATKKAPAKPPVRKAAAKPPVKKTAAKKAPAKRAPAKRAAAKKAVDTKPEARRPGPVETKVRADVGALVSVHPMGEALAAMSFALAQGIDSGPEMMRAALNRELRLNLLALSGMSVGGDDLGDALSSPEGGEGG